MFITERCLEFSICQIFFNSSFTVSMLERFLSKILLFISIKLFFILLKIDCKKDSFSKVLYHHIGFGDTKTQKLTFVSDDDMKFKTIKPTLKQQVFTNMVIGINADCINSRNRLYKTVFGKSYVICFCT